MGRQLINFVGGFEQYLRATNSPQRFKKWAGFACISGALERRVSTHNRGEKGAEHGTIYPSIFAFLIGNSSIGKTPPVKLCRRLWTSVPSLNVSVESLTAASFFDELQESPKRSAQNSDRLEHPLLIATDELGSFFLAYDKQFLCSLSKAYDCDDLSERRRTNKNGERQEVNDVHTTFLAAVQPSVFGQLFPDEAYKQGFMPRTFLIFSDERVKLPVFMIQPGNGELRKKLEHDIARIAELEGEFTWSQDAQDAISRWYELENDVPKHPRMQDYVPRRLVHAMKLAMLSSVSMGDSLRVEVSHFHEARAMMCEMEQQVPHIFDSMVLEGNNSIIIEAAVDYLQRYGANMVRGEVHEHVLIEYLCQKIKATLINSIVDALLGSGRLRNMTPGKVRGDRMFKVPQALSETSDETKDEEDD